MKKVFILLLLLMVSKIYAQQHKYVPPFKYPVDSLKQRLRYAEADTNRVKLLDSLGEYYSVYRTDSALVYLRQALPLSQKLKFKTGEIKTLLELGFTLALRGDYPTALSKNLTALRLAENAGDKNLLYKCFDQIGDCNYLSNYYQKASNYLNLVQNHLAELKWPDLEIEASYTFTAGAFLGMEKIDSAQYFMRKAYLLDLKTKSRFYPTYRLIAKLAEKKGEYQKAINYIHSFSHGSDPEMAKLFSYGYLAQLYQKIGKTDSAIYFAWEAIKNQKKLGMLLPILEASQTLTEVYTSSHQIDSAFKYQTLMLALKDSMVSQQKTEAIEDITLGEQQRRQELVIAEQKYKSHIRIYILAAALVVFLVVGLILWRNYKKQKQTNLLLSEQKEEISTQKDALEDKNRNLEIQASLERVRSRTMGMQKSEELKEIIRVVYEQLVQLNILAEHAGFIMDYKANDDMHIWLADKHYTPSRVTVPYFDCPHWNSFNEAIEKGLDFFANHHTFEEKNKFYQGLFKLFPGVTDETKEYYFNCPGLAVSTVLLENVGLYIENFAGTPYTDEENATLMRFGKVFQQTYTRFLDLQKAEAQAREAQIEAALERVRSRTMAMHNSQDVADTSVTMFQELVKLGVESTVRCGVSIISSVNDLEVWTASLKDDGSVTLNIGRLDMTAHPLLLHVFTAWENKESSTTYELTGEAVRSYFQALNNAPGYPFQYPMDSLPEKWGINAFFFPEGCLFAFTGEPLSPEMSHVFKRFAGVFGQTYTRFLDLQKAELQAREAIKQASVDRVRGEIASMRTTQDLDRITPLIWNELTILGIPFIRCGVFIVDEQEEVFHTHLSTADGKALATFNLQFDAEGIGQNVLSAWRKKQIATIHWSKEEFATYNKNLVSQGTVRSKGRYVTEHPDTSLDLHFLPFLQGMLYVGNTTPLTDDEMSLVQSLADAFSTAYARYEDFNKLEAAKQQVENTLTDLKATQTKLIQSEKMASLGELTAGIAHEIQNPLNFVNNFSEVNREMIDELEEELRSGNIEEALAIAADIKTNEQKINHHGKRADAIVKGMLQHSRTSGGEKLPTNINALTEEFMRLSYHGLRAKDKTFNAEMVTHFDPELPKVNVIGQDIGRVLLNLFNNAFYAVNQKAKTAGPDYKPVIEVTTFFLPLQGVGGLKVKDNGAGIPDAIKEKIMQPFFTTKPTGEGTGLGLSLTYDMVVKGHGGSIQVNTKEGEGSEFIIALPVN